MFYVLLPIVLAIGLLVVVALIASAIAVLYTALPFFRKKVPLRYNLRNLQVRWKTTLVTALAFTLVTALLTVMLAFVRGMDNITQSSAVPGNVIVLADGATDEVFSDVGDPSVTQFSDDIQKMIKRDGKKGKHLMSKEVYVLVSHVVENAGQSGRKRRFIQLRGVNDPVISAKVHDLKLAKGEWWSASGVREVVDNRPTSADSSDGRPRGIKTSVMEVVVGDGIAKTLGTDIGKSALSPGDLLQIGPNLCYVTGVLDPHGSFGSEVWARDQQIQGIFNRGNKFSSFVVRTANDEAGAKLADKLKKQSTGDKYNASTEKAYYERLEASNNVFRIAIYFFGIVMAVGGVLGVMNTMFAAISQRARDIGVLRLLGYTRFQILCSFLFESLIIAALGGLLGCCIGLFTNGWTATSIVSGANGGGKSVVLQLVIDIWVLIPGLALALVMGAVGGLIPSLNAMRLRPLESLR
ncbi:MAG: ABC transporter permease [Gemmataceae bacterium]